MTINSSQDQKILDRPCEGYVETNPAKIKKDCPAPLIKRRVMSIKINSEFKYKPETKRSQKPLISASPIKAMSTSESNVHKKFS